MIERLLDKNAPQFDGHHLGEFYDKIQEIIDAVNALELAVECLNEIDLGKYGV